MVSVEEEGKKDKTKRKAIVLVGLGLIITLFLTLFCNDIGLKLSIGGIGATIIVAVLIYILQNSTTTELKRLTEKMKILTCEIHTMTEEYKERREIRVKKFKDIAIPNLKKVKEQYEELYCLIDKYEHVENKENEQNILNFIPDSSIESIISDTKLLVQVYFDFTFQYLHDLGLIQWLQIDLQRIGEPLEKVLEYNFDNKDTKNLISLKRKINSIIKEIEKYIEKIRLEKV